MLSNNHLANNNINDREFETNSNIFGFDNVEKIVE